MKEIILVEVIDGEELDSYAEAFKDVEEAEKFFIEKLKILYPQIEDDEITSYLEDGYFADDTHLSLIMKEIPLK